MVRAPNLLIQFNRRHQLLRLHTECSGKLLNGVKPDRAPAPFDQRDVRPVQGGRMGEFLLGQTPVFTDLPHAKAESLDEEGRHR